MPTMYVSFLVDLFQPATQGYTVVDEIARECYGPLVEIFNSDLAPKFTVSMSNSLASLLHEYGKDQVIDDLREAINSRKVELIHTGAHHPIFPLIPKHEVVRQIELDIKFKQEFFGPTERTGILSPELCYDDTLVPFYKNLGFRWTVTDDLVMGSNGIMVNGHEVFLIRDFAVFMRSSFWSDRIRKPDDSGRYMTGREFVEHMRREIEGQEQDCYKVIVLSGETFGHHVKYFEETFLRDMLFALKRCDSVRLCLMSELLEVESLRKIEKRREQYKGFDYFPLSSWATQPDDYRRGDPYPLWHSGGNPIHEKLWALTGLIFDSCANINFANNDNQNLRELLDRAFYSTQYFWASIWFWRPELVYEGIDLQMRALYKCARLTGNREILNKGQELYAGLMWEIYARARREGWGDT
jgi:hypothetical protein